MDAMVNQHGIAHGSHYIYYDMAGLRYDPTIQVAHVIGLNGFHRQHFDAAEKEGRHDFAKTDGNFIEDRYAMSEASCDANGS